MYAAIGQENTRCTPLQLANYVATLANGGKHYPVHLLKTVKTNDFSQVVEEYEPEPLDTIDIAPENLSAWCWRECGRWPAETVLPPSILPT